MEATIRVVLGVATILIALGSGLLGVASFFAEPLIDQGNPPIGDVYRFSGGMIMPSTPHFFIMAAALSSVATTILYKVRFSSSLSGVLYWLALVYSTLAALSALVCAGVLFSYGHKYA